MSNAVALATLELALILSIPTTSQKALRLLPLLYNHKRSLCSRLLGDGKKLSHYREIVRDPIDLHLGA